MGSRESGGGSGTAGRARVAAPAALSPVEAIMQPTGRTINVSAEAKSKIDSIFGRQLSNDELADLVGAPGNSRINVSIEGPDLSIHGVFDQGRFSRTVFIGPDGKIEMANGNFKLEDDAPPGLGTAIFTKQVQNARKQGVSLITTWAAGNKAMLQYSNGYYTWPRLGYDANLGSTFFDIPPPIRSTMARPQLSELMKTQAGRDWWKENGNSTTMEFDLNPNSNSSRILDAYNEERKNRG